MRHSLPIVFAALLLSSAAFAQNEECTGAVAVVNGANGPFSNVGSTTSLPAWPCGAGANDIWFVYTATCTGTATFDTCGSGFDTVIQAFDTGACGNTCAANFPNGGPCNDDTCGLQSSTSLSVANGGLYYIRVGGFGGATGAFGLNIACVAGGGPADDECAGATPIALGLTPGLTNVGYTTSSPTWPCGAGGNDRWFSYLATCTAPHTIDLCGAGTSYDTTLEVFSGACPCGLASLGCNDDSCGLRSSLTVNMTQGQTYLIRVGGFASLTGTFDLNLATGTGNGTFTTLAHQCNGAGHVGITIAASGSPNIGGTIVLTSAASTGIPFMTLGLNPLNAAFFCCTLGHDFGFAIIVGASVSLPVPCDATLIGGNVYAQALDLGGNGGCVTAPQVNLTDTIQITIG